VKRRLPLLTGVSLALGLLTVAWPLAWAPGWAYAAAVAGALAVLAAAFAGWRYGPALAAAAAIASAAFSRAGTAVLAAEGLFILAYLVTAGAPPGLTRPGAQGRWLAQQARPAVAGLIAAGAVLAALALHRADATWLTVAGLAAAVAAYLMALPRPRALSRRLTPDGPGRRASSSGRRRPAWSTTGTVRPRTGRRTPSRTAARGSSSAAPRYRRRRPRVLPPANQTVRLGC
jgi:hypothetical protein